MISIPKNLRLVVLYFSMFWVSNALANHPEFGSLKKNEVNVRAGPGTQYPILWIFKQSMYPIRILAVYQNWYKIQDPEGEEGWIYKGLVSSRRTALVSPGKPTDMYKRSDSSIAHYRLEPGVIVGLKECTPHMCQVSLGRSKGWVVKNRLLMVEVED